MATCCQSDRTWDHRAIDAAPAAPPVRNPHAPGDILSPSDTSLDRVLARALDQWPGAGGVAVVGPSGVLAQAGSSGVHALASVTKPLTALAILDLVWAGEVSLDDPVGPPGSTLRHLLAHASGLHFEGDRVMTSPATRRIYSNRGIEVAAEHVTRATGLAFADVLAESILEPLDMSETRLTGSPAYGASGTVADLARLAHELLAAVGDGSSLLDAGLVAAASTTTYAGLAGLLPGFGRQDPNDWGLGFEVRAAKSPHWTSADSSPATFGHFGQSGSFLWVDPEAGLACVGAGSAPFGPWAVDLWPRLATEVLATGR